MPALRLAGIEYRNTMDEKGGARRLACARSRYR
ncbi:hypothetical protein ABIA25_006359 [Sinorhizobium fredii]